MKLEINQDVVITTTFSDGKELIWNAAIYSRINEIKQNKRRLFTEANSFIESLPANKQLAVEAFYKRCNRILVGGMEKESSTADEFRKILNAMDEALAKEIGELYSFITLEAIAYWRERYNGIAIPPDLKDEYGYMYPKEGTYLRKEYIELVDFCIATRLLVPIWCEYIQACEGIITDNMLEVGCIELLRYAPGLLKSTAMDKLKEYINASAKLDFGKAGTAIINGMSRHDIPRWVLSVTLVKRLGITDLSATDGKGHLITAMYGFMQGILNRDLDRKNAGRVRDKFRQLGDFDEPDKRSLVEEYYINQDVTMGDISVYETYIEQYTENAAMKLMERRTLTDKQKKNYLNKVKTCVDYMKRINDTEISTAQETILSWIVADIIPWKMMPKISSSSYRVLMGIAQAYAWYFDLSDVAVAVSAKQNVELTDNALVNTPSARISPRMHQKLCEIYNFSHPREVNKRDDHIEDLSNNVAVKALREVIRGLNNDLFIARVPSGLFEMNYHSSGCVIFKNVSEQLVTLIELLNEKEEEKEEEVQHGK